MEVPAQLALKLQGTDLLEKLRAAKPDDTIEILVYVNLLSDKLTEQEKASLAGKEVGEFKRRYEINTHRLDATYYWLQSCIQSRQPGYHISSSGLEGSPIIGMFVKCNFNMLIPASVAVQKLTEWFGRGMITEAYTQIDLDNAYAKVSPAFRRSI